MPRFTWTEDDDGDWQCYVDGVYFGMVCPHSLAEKGYCRVVVDGHRLRSRPTTLAEAQRYLERHYQGTVVADLAYRAVMEEVGD
jgi:hypothetical protein